MVITMPFMESSFAAQPRGTARSINAQLRARIVFEHVG
jgi:hypothetical protein